MEPRAKESRLQQRRVIEREVMRVVDPGVPLRLMPLQQKIGCSLDLLASALQSLVAHGLVPQMPLSIRTLREAAQEAVITVARSRPVTSTADVHAEYPGTEPGLLMEAVQTLIDPQLLVGMPERFFTIPEALIVRVLGNIPSGIFERLLMNGLSDVRQFAIATEQHPGDASRLILNILLSRGR
jgi:hypothetical protein